MIVQVVSVLSYTFCYFIQLIGQVQVFLSFFYLFYLSFITVFQYTYYDDSPSCVSSFLYVLLFYSIDWTSIGISFFLLFILFIINYGISVYILTMMVQVVPD